MNQLERQLQRAARDVQLTPKDKALMRERLVSYMEHKPIRSRQTQTRRSFSIPAFSFFRAHHYQGALAVALLATVSTFGVSSAADDALPGDLLYPVKVKVNEEIKTVFLGSDEEQLLWESKRAELRLQEASQLASEGRLDTNKQEAVAKLLAEHTEAVAEKVHALEETDPALAVEVSTDLEAALGAHEVVLARLIVEQEDGGEESKGLVEKVRTAAKETEKAREGAEQILEDAEMDVTESTETAQDDESDTSSTDTLTADDEATAGAPTLSTDSANMRERAVYRAQQRATESLARARELVLTLDQESDLAQQATEQLAFGESLMAQGTAMLADHELGKTYGFYRRADMIFQKVARLLEALNLFSVEILHETVVEELPTVEDAEAEALLTTEDTTENAPDVFSQRADIEHTLSETRSLLLAVDGYDEGLVIQANSLMKDAMALMLRGDIAHILGEEANAEKLFAKARTQAERAYDMVEKAAHDLGVVDVVTPDAAVSDSAALTLTHDFAEGTHTWKGSVDTQTSCETVGADASVAESYPEQITITVTTQEQVGDAPCIEASTSNPFEVQAAASQEAVVRAVLVDGVETSFVVVQSAAE